MANIKLPLKPGFYQLFIRHDDWCLLLSRTGPCNCNPDAELIEVTDDNHEAVANQIAYDYRRLEALRQSKLN